jgi:hypothetical protein
VFREIIGFLDQGIIFLSLNNIVGHKLLVDHSFNKVAMVCACTFGFDRLPSKSFHEGFLDSKGVPLLVLRRSLVVACLFFIW